MSKEKKDPEVVWSDAVREQAEKDPKIAEYLREFGAKARQAMLGVQTGQYKDFAEGIEKLTGSRPKRVDPDDPIIADIADDDG